MLNGECQIIKPDYHRSKHTSPFRSRGISLVLNLMGARRILLRKPTLGMDRAHVTWAHWFPVVCLRAPPRREQRQQA